MGSPSADASTIHVKVNGVTQQFTEQEPIFYHNRTLVPLREIFESLGADVQWDGTNQRVTATRGGSVVSIGIGSETAYRNQQKIDLDVPAIIVHNKTLVPVRFVAEALGAKVDWDASTSTVLIFTSDAPTLQENAPSSTSLGEQGSGLSSDPTTETTSDISDEKAIKKVIDANLLAFNKRDIDAFMKTVATDLNSSRYEDLRSMLKKLFDNYKVSSYFEKEDILSNDGKTARVDLVQVTKHVDDSDFADNRTESIQTMIKVNDEWKFDADVDVEIESFERLN